MHTLRLDGMPRRYITYAGFMSNYNRFCSFRALSSIIFLFTRSSCFKSFYECTFCIYYAGFKH